MRSYTEVRVMFCGCAGICLQQASIQVHGAASAFVANWKSLWVATSVGLVLGFLILFGVSMKRISHLSIR